MLCVLLAWLWLYLSEYSQDAISAVFSSNVCIAHVYNNICIRSVYLLVLYRHIDMQQQLIEPKTLYIYISNEVDLSTSVSFYI